MVVDSIKSDLNRTQSSLKGRQKFTGLSPKYKNFKRDQGKAGIPNMKLTEKMVGKLIHQNRVGNKIEVGIFSGKDALKADNHNKFSGQSKRTKVPKRQFIPKTNQTFRAGIERKVNKMINEAVHEESK